MSLSQVGFAPAAVSGGQLSRKDYEERRDAATAFELAKLQTSPEFKQWESGKRRRGVQKVLSWQSLLSVTVLLLLGSGGYFLVQNAPAGLSLGGGRLPADVTKLIDSGTTQKDTASVKTPTQEPTTMQMTEQAALADQRGKQVERLTAEVVRLKTEGEAQLGARAQLKQEVAQKEEQLRSMMAERDAERAKARAEAQQLKDAVEKAAAAGNAKEEQLRRELKSLAARLERAQEINPPPSVVSASTLAIIFLALLATSALAFWFSAAKSARDQVLELEELRLQAEEQERRHREEKSMIGRLQNELVAANAERSRQDHELAAVKRQLAYAQTQVTMLGSKVEERDSRLSAQKDCFDELDRNYMETKAEKDGLDMEKKCLEVKLGELEDRNRKLEADAAAAALESAAGPSTSTPQRQPPSKSWGTDKENAGSSHINAKRALKAPVDVVLAENSAFRQQLEAYKRREEELTKEVAAHEAAEEELKKQISELHVALSSQQSQDAAASQQLALEITQLEQQLQDVIKAGQRLEEDWSLEVAEMQDKLEIEIASRTDLLNQAAMDKTIMEQSLADIVAKAQSLQEQRDMLLVQLSLAEEEKAAAAHAAAIADAEAQWHDKMCRMLEEELRSEERHGRMVEGDFRDACDQVHALLLRLTQRLRYEDAEVEVDRRQSQVEELQRVRLQLEGQVEDLAAKLKDVDAENGRLKVEVASLKRQCNDLEQQLLVKVSELTEAVKMKEHLSGLLEGNTSTVARLQRDNENLEGQVDQLTISLVDATSKKTVADKRLRQYQQDLDEMELLMARADEERRALEREVKHMRSTASEATSQLMLAEEMARDLGDPSSDVEDGEVQSQAQGNPVQTPISAALSLMQKMDGVARLLGGSETPWYTSPASKASCSSSARTSPALKSAHLSQGGTVRMINFMGRAAGKLGTLSRGRAGVEEEGSQRSGTSREPLVLPSSSEISPRATPGSAFSKAAARMDSEVALTRTLKAELQREDAKSDRMQQHLSKAAASGVQAEGASLKADRLQLLRSKMHEAFREALARETAMQRAALQASAAEEAAAGADAEYAEGQHEVEVLMEERRRVETAAAEVSAAVEAANVQLADALQLKQAAEAALEEFEAKGLGAFGGGNDSAVVWRDRVDAQDAYAAAAQAKAAALQRKEEAMAAKRTVLARLEAAIRSLAAAEDSSAAATESARVAAADLDDHVEATIEAQRAFQKARKALAEGVGELAQQMGVEIRPTEAPGSRPASGASSTGSAASAASKPRLSIPDGSALHTPQAQVVRGVSDRHAPNAERQAAQTSMRPAGDEQAVAAGDEGQESEQRRSFGQPARLQQHAKQPAVASVMANASASQIAAPGFPSAVATQDASDPKDAAVQEKDSPGSVENQAKRANTRTTPPSREGLSGLLRGFAFKPAMQNSHSASVPTINSLKTGVSSTSLRGGDSGKSARGRRNNLGPVQDRNALVLMDNGWSGALLD
ncbi:g9575 [Coccomyxa elongata]